MDVEGFGGEFAERGFGAGLVERVLVGEAEQELVGLTARVLVVAVEVFDVVLEFVWELAEAGSAAEGGERDVDEGVVAGGLFTAGPEPGLGDAPDQREGGADAAELLVDLGGVGELVGAGKASAFC